MNKLSLALAVALAATSATVNAGTVYKKDGLTIKMDGDIQIQLRRRVSSGLKEDFHVDFDDSEIKNKISYDLGNGLTGFAEAHFDTDKSGTSNVTSEETFVGLKTEKFKVQLGRMDYVTDDFATERAIEGATKESVFYANGAVNGSDVILFEANAGAFSIAASHDFGQSTGSATRNTDLQSTDLYVSTQIGAVTFGAATQSLEKTSGATKINTTGFSATFEGSDFDIAVDTSKSNEVGVNLKMTNVSVGVPVAKTTKITLGVVDQSNTAGTAPDAWYANVVYKFPKAKKVSLFAEIQDDDSAGSSTGFLAGMRVKF